MYVRKKASEIKAWRLGDKTPKELEMIAEKKIVDKGDGTYELFSREATGKKGQIAKVGDYFKVDSGGYPYPNDKETFEATHVRIEGDRYLQSTPELYAWTLDQPITDAVKYLFDNNLVQIHDDDPNRYFSAVLWGTTETAAKDVVIVFYKIERDGNGNVINVDFNFVERSEFEKTYRVVLPWVRID